MANVNELLQQKYRILGETADSERDLRSAQAGLLGSQTQTNPIEAAARAASGFGAAASSRAQAGLLGAQTATQPSTAASENLLRAGQGDFYGAEGRRANAEVDAGNAPFSGFGGNSFADGTASVPGKMPPKGQNTDVTPANLTPGEAVLNRGAAEHLGRNVIDVLNAIGNIKMAANGTASVPDKGAAAPIAGGAGIPGYASGSSGVGTVGQGTGSGIDPIAGQGGTWTPPPATGGGGSAIRASLGMGVPRPKPLGFAEGTSEVPGYAGGIANVMAMTHADAARNSGVPEGRKSEKGKEVKGAPKAKPENGVKANQQPDTMGWGTGNKSDAPGYAKGTSKVPGKGAKGPAEKGKSAITPEMIQHIMALGQGGGGMPQPAPGAPGPMPMPMPPSGGPM